MKGKKSTDEDSTQAISAPATCMAYTIEDALNEVREKYKDSIKEIRTRSLYHQANELLKVRRAEAGQGPRIFSGEAEYKQWLEQHGLTETDSDDYTSQTSTTEKLRRMSDW